MEKEKILSFDLHTHLLERKLKPVEWWKSALGSNLDAIAITEHSDKKPKEAFLKLNSIKPKQATLIPGMEITSAVGHILAYSKNPEIYEIEEFLEIGIPLKKLYSIAKKEKIALSFAHPWGFAYDSAGYLMGTNKLAWFVRNNDIGVEAYNGMIGQIMNFVQTSKWFHKTRNFFEKLEKNRVSKKIRLAKISGKIKNKIDSKSNEVITRCALGIELGEEASYITAGSDAHSTDRIGMGIIQFKEEKNFELNNESAIELLRQKEKTIWTGPQIIQLDNGQIIRKNQNIKKKEVFLGLKYAAKVMIKKRKMRKKIEERKNDIANLP